MCSVHDQFSRDPVELQLAQMPQLGGRSAYPDQPDCDCKFENVRAEEEVVEVEPEDLSTVESPTASFTIALEDAPHLSHSWTAML